MIIEKVRKFIEDNNINKRELADKMHISEHKLDRILNTSDDILNCMTYRKVCVALGVSADTFIK